MEKGKNEGLYFIFTCKQNAIVCIGIADMWRVNVWMYVRQQSNHLLDELRKRQSKQRLATFSHSLSRSPHLVEIIILVCFRG